jgi:hypothetical protein
MPTAHPVNELLVALGRRPVLELLWTLRDAPLPAPDDADDDIAEHLEELRRNGLVRASDGDAATWDLTPDGRALADQLLTLATRAARRGGGLT